MFAIFDIFQGKFNFFFWKDLKIYHLYWSGLLWLSCQNVTANLDNPQDILWYTILYVKGFKSLFRFFFNHPRNLYPKISKIHYPAQDWGRGHFRLVMLGQSFFGIHRRFSTLEVIKRNFNATFLKFRLFGFEVFFYSIVWLLNSKITTNRDTPQYI